MPVRTSVTTIGHLFAQVRQYGQRHPRLTAAFKGGVLFSAGLTIGLLYDGTPSHNRITEPPQQQATAHSTANITGTGLPLPSDAASSSPTDNNLPRLAQTEHYNDLPAAPAAIPLRRETITLGRGDTLMDIMVDAGASRRDSHSAIQTLGKLINLRRLQVGQRLTLGFHATPDPHQSQLQELVLQKNFDEKIVVSRREGDAPRYDARTVEINVTRESYFASGTIEDSLYLAAQQQDVPAPVIAELIRILSFDVDFQREIRSGDRFEVYYENLTSAEDGQQKAGNILYAGLTLRGKPIELYRYDSPGIKRADYYHSNGQSARRTLMRTPIDGARLTSRFGKRKHPILGYTKMHKGIDFGARTGTPIMAAGDGMIEMSQRNGGYGNYIRIRHNGTYKTAYAHLSRYGKGIRKGRKVRQGQIIGYVGSTGRSTGPHLHYEVIVNGKQVNPLSLKLPTGRKLKGADLDQFQQQVNLLQTQIATVRPAVQVAQD
ncbi:MAG: peptidase M23 [Kordiimonas sp.]|nr:peptidase M23 [Kordiimonas sp.]